VRVNLLSVDWDYFVPSIDREFALGATEGFSDAMIDALWDARMAQLVATGQRLPGTSGEEEDFWGRFLFQPEAELFYADSHAQAVHPALRREYRQVWNFDSHHDAGYEGRLDDVFRLGWVGCANWMCYYYLRGAALHVRYPAWRDDAVRREVPPLCPVEREIDSGEAVPLVFDAVFVARSGALTPPWLDERFHRFLHSAPLREKRCLDYPWHERPLDRDWIAHLEKQVLPAGRSTVLAGNPS
jgi:hypothetical protein